MKKGVRKIRRKSRRSAKYGYVGDARVSTLLISNDNNKKIWPDWIMDSRNQFARDDVDIQLSPSPVIMDQRLRNGWGAMRFKSLRRKVAPIVNADCRGFSIPKLTKLNELRAVA